MQQTSFQKNIQNITYPEAAMLIGLLQNPSLYNPRVRPERTLARRNTVLSQLAKYEYIAESDAEN
ncbi:MAG: transglycosylase domain-containing protein, partial [Bacteroidetes bacterium]|nr:transglycosylase domain-containing protein [Bacteroidota bacterium]